MNILFLTQFFSPNKGGGEVMFYQLANQLGMRGHKIFIIKHKMLGPDSSKDNLGSLSSNVIVYEVDPAVEHKGGLPAGIPQNLLYILNSVKVGLKIIKNNRIDMIHCNAYSPVFAGWLLSKLTGIPLIITIHDVAILYGFRFWKKWMEQFTTFSSIKALIGYILELLVVRLSKNVHTVSDTNEKDILCINPRCNVVVIPNGLNLEWYNVEPINITYDNFILFVGRLVHYKNLNVVIEAFKLLKGRCNVKLIVLGDGPMKSSWQRLVKKYGLEDMIEFKGHVSHIEKINLLGKTRALVLPSIFEGFGIVVLEAWALKKPVIVADIEPLNRLVQQSVNGFLAKPNDPYEWAEFISRLINDENLARRLGENGFQKLLRNYTITMIVKELENVYLEVLRRKIR